VCDPDGVQIGRALSSTFLAVDQMFADILRPAFRVGFTALCRVGCCSIAAVITDTAVVVANGACIGRG
jgi:hypothetical protein